MRKYFAIACLTEAGEKCILGAVEEKFFEGCGHFYLGDVDDGDTEVCAVEVEPSFKHDEWPGITRMGRCREGCPTSIKINYYIYTVCKRIFFSKSCNAQAIIMLF